MDYAFTHFGQAGRKFQFDASPPFQTTKARAKGTKPKGIASHGQFEIDEPISRLWPSFPSKTPLAVAVMAASRPVQNDASSGMPFISHAAFPISNQKLYLRDPVVWS